MSRVVGVVGSVVWLYFQAGNPQAWAFFASQVYGANEDRKARRDKRRAIARFNESQRDRLEMALYDAYQARTLVMGRQRVTEGRRGRFIQSGTNLEKLSFFVSVAGHEIDGFEKHYIFDDEVTLDGSGYVQPTALGTAAGYTTNGSALAVGTTSIPLITGTGTILANDCVQFDGDATKYKVATGISAPGTLVLAAPGLRRAIAASAVSVNLYKAPYTKTRRDYQSNTGTADGSGNVTITLSTTPVAGTALATWSTNAGESLTQGSATVSVSGTTATVTGAQALSTVTVTYGVDVTTYYVRLRPYLGTDTQSVATDVASEYGGKMRSTDHYRGMAGYWIDLTYDTDVFPQGIPTFSALVRGAKLYDPRKDSTNGGSGSHRLATKSTWEWSENPELQAAHYARWYAGWALPDSAIPWAEVASEAAVCDGSTVYTLESVNSQRVLALNFEGASVVDSSVYARTVTNSGVTISSTQHLNGSSSGLFSTSGTSVSVDVASELNPGTDDFTIEGDYYPTVVDATRRSVVDWRFDGSGSGTTLALDYTSSDVRFQVGIGSTVYTAQWSSGSFTISAHNAWAIARQGTTIRLYVGGVQRASATVPSGALNTSTGGSRPFFGRKNDGSQNAGGYMDRINWERRCLYPDGTTYTPPSDLLTANNVSTTTLPRYQCGIAIPSDMDHQAAMDAIVESMAGRWCWFGDQLRTRSGHMRTPVGTIDEAWIMQNLGADGEPEDTESPVSGTLKVARQNRINRVTGRFTDPDQRYQQMPFAAVQDDTLVALRGANATELEFEGVNQHAQAQNLARIAIREAQAGFRLQLAVGLRALKMDMLDVWAVDLPRYGISGKTCELVGFRPSHERPSTIRLAEITDAMFDPTEPLDGRDPAPDSGLRPPWQVPPVTGLAVTSGTTAQTDGSVLVRTEVTWTAVADEAIRKSGDIEVQYTEATGTLPSGDWASWTEPGTATKAIIPGLLANRHYLFKVRVVQRNPLVRGAWSDPVRYQIVPRPSTISRYAGSNVLTIADGTTGGTVTFTPPLNAVVIVTCNATLSNVYIGPSTNFNMVGGKVQIDMDGSFYDEQISETLVQGGTSAKAVVTSRYTFTGLSVASHTVGLRFDTTAVPSGCSCGLGGGRYSVSVDVISGG